MLILGVDAATTSGFALGRAGEEKPRAWSKRLKGPDDEPERAFKKMTIELRDTFVLDKPDLVIVEEHMLQDRTGQSNAKTNYLLGGLVAVVFGVCGAYGIRVVKHKPTEARKHFVGRTRPDDPKREVLQRCKMLGYLPRDSRDTDAADACALWDFAWSKYASHIARELHLYGEGVR